MSKKSSYSVTVNGHTVVFDDKHQSGLSVKEAAAEQGAGIHIDFVLSQELQNGKTKVLGDDDKVTLKDGLAFLAVPNDDDSREIKNVVEFAIGHIRKNYPDAKIDVAEDGNGGAFVTIDSVSLGPVYEQDSTWIAFHITEAAEYADVYPHFVRPDLIRLDEGPLGQGFGIVEFQHPNGARPAVQLSRRTNKTFEPSIRNPAIKLEKVLDWLRTR